MLDGKRDRGSDRKVTTLVLVEDACKHRRRVKVGDAEALDRPIDADQGGGAQVADAVDGRESEYLRRGGTDRAWSARGM